MGQRLTASAFKRRILEVREPQRQEPATDEFNVLVINSSQVMAKEITMELALRIPGCSIMYAPSIELAKWILRRRKLQLVVSSPILPDGGIVKLRDTLENMESPPDLMVVGELHSDAVTALNSSIYRCTALKRYNSRSRVVRPAAVKKNENLGRKIADLGADLRNDLNNPLQEIVAMVFVAQAAGVKGAPNTQEALCAIDKAAKNMAKVVNGLEDKIRNVVVPGSEG